MQITTTEDVMSPEEKRILRNIVDESPPLEYPTRALEMSVGPDALEYVIPRKDKEKVLKALYPFFPTPKLDDIRQCLHEEKKFKVRDFKVIREDNRNYLVSPFYAKSGGMVIDWMDAGDEKGGAYVLTNKETATP